MLEASGWQGKVFLYLPFWPLNLSHESRVRMKCSYARGRKELRAKRLQDLANMFWQKPEESLWGLDREDAAIRSNGTWNWIARLHQCGNVLPGHRIEQPGRNPR